MDWIELIIFAIIVLTGLLFGEKKKQQQQGRSSTQRPRARPHPRPMPRAQRPPSSAQRPAPTIAEQILEQIRQRDEAEREGVELEPLHTEEAVSLETAGRPRTGVERPERTAESLETLEPAGGASHERFHERYISPLVEPVRRQTRPRVLPTPTSARQAVMWMAVFGRPKGLE